MNTRVRRPAVAGSFYPGEAEALRAEVGRLLDGAGAPSGPRPRALIVPHAGYIYSGPVAATAYAALKPHAVSIRRVVLLGPSHHVPLDGIALPDADAMATPLGEVAMDADACTVLDADPAVAVSAAAHAREHSLEVQLPFLQFLLEKFTLVPLVVGDADAATVGRVLSRLWGGDETLVVVSSDLSHYHADAEARRIDAATAAQINALESTPLSGDQACGCRPIGGLLATARADGLHVTELDRRNSGDTAGDRSRVVGYGAWSFHAAA